MSNTEQIQQATKDFGEAATASAHTFATSLQTIASAHADFAKKLMQHASEFTSQLTSVKEPAKLMEIQSEYAKNAYETFVAEAKRISELYADLFKQTTKPFEDLMAKNKSGLIVTTWGVARGSLPFHVDTFSTGSGAVRCAIYTRVSTEYGGQTD